MSKPKFDPLKVRLYNFEDGNGPQISHVYGRIDGMENLQALVKDYLDNSYELDLKPGEMMREITLILDRETRDDGWGYVYYLTEKTPVKVRRYNQRDLRAIEARKNAPVPDDDIPF